MKILDGRKKFLQWDRDVKITAKRLNVGDKVHFHNGTTKEAQVLTAKQYGETVAVEVPNDFLTTSFPIKAYRYVETENGSYTEQRRVFEVESRPKPADYVYTQTEVFNFNDLKEEIKNTMGDVLSVLDELHAYAQSLVNGGVSE